MYKPVENEATSLMGMHKMNLNEVFTVSYVSIFLHVTGPGCELDR